MKLLSIVLREQSDGQVALRLMDDRNEFRPTSRELEIHDALAQALNTLLTESGAVDLMAREPMLQ